MMASINIYMNIIPIKGHGFCYLHTNISKGHKNYKQKYVGFKSFFKSNGKETNWRTYIGSYNKELKHDFKELGWEGFKRRYLFIGKIDQAREKEVYYHNLWDVCKNPKFYNNAKQLTTYFSTSGREIPLAERKRRSLKMSNYIHIFNEKTNQRKMIPITNLDQFSNDWKRGRPINHNTKFIHNIHTQEEKRVELSELSKYLNKEWKEGRSDKMAKQVRDNLYRGCRKPRSLTVRQNMSKNSWNNRPVNILNILTGEIFNFYNLKECSKKLHLTPHYVKLLINKITIKNFISVSS